MTRRGATALWRGVCAALIVAVALACPATARTLAAIEASGTLRVGLTGDYPPYALRRPDGSFTGADVAMARAVAAALGVTLAIVPTTWQRLSADLRADRFDVAMGGVSVTPARAAIGEFSLTVVRDGKRPIARCADKDRYTSLRAIDRPGVRVAVNRGGTNELFATAHFPHARLIEHADNQAIFADIAAGRADVVVTDGAEVDYQARRHPGILCAANVPAPFDHFDKAYWMTRDLRLKAVVDAVLKKKLAAGDYRRALAAAASAQ
jgi:cyclohexadienyl dehydratase